MTTTARVRRVAISPDILVCMFETGTAWRVEQGIPEDATLRGFTLDPYANVLNLFIEHQSFEEVEVNSVAPTLEMLFKRM